jgi:hypothetical protein
MVEGLDYGFAVARVRNARRELTAQGGKHVRPQPTHSHCIDKLPASRFARGRTSTIFGENWIVCGSYPATDAREYRDARPAREATRDIRNYVLVIGHDFSDDPDTFRYIFHGDGGVSWEFERDDDFAANVQAFIDHETRDPATGKPAHGNRLDELMFADADDATGPVTTANRVEFNEGEVRDIYNEMDRYSFSQARLLGVDANIFEAIERAWNAANQFCDFTVARPSY